MIKIDFTDGMEFLKYNLRYYVKRPGVPMLPIHSYIGASSVELQEALYFELQSSCVIERTPLKVGHFK